MAVRGSFAQLDKLRGQFKGVVIQQMQRKLLKNLGEQAVKLVRDGFADSHDPYGVEWAPLQNRDGQALLRTGRLRKSITWMLTPNGFKLSTNVKYAIFHQLGTAGRSQDSTRTAIVGGDGKFMSQARAQHFGMSEEDAADKRAQLMALGRYKGRQKDLKRLTRNTMSLRTLSFKKGSGGIPARPFLPGASLPPTWAHAFEGVADRILSAYFK